MGEYATDLLAWSEHEGALLRRPSTGDRVNEADLDWPNIADEIESLGRWERRALESHVRTIIEHLAKLQASPATAPRARWEDAVLRARIELEDVLETSPSLRRHLHKAVERAHGRALHLAVSGVRMYGEVPRVPAEMIRFSIEQVLGPWMPE